MTVMRGSEIPDRLDHLRNDGFECEIRIVDLLGLIPQMTAGFRTLDHDRIGNVPILGKPLCTQQLGRTCRRDDRRQFRLGSFGEGTTGRLSGKPAPEKIISAFSAMAVFTISAKLDMATITLTPIIPRVFSRALRNSCRSPSILAKR